jgi:hypothetical protein
MVYSTKHLQSNGEDIIHVAAVVAEKQAKVVL